MGYSNSAQKLNHYTRCCQPGQSSETRNLIKHVAELLVIVSSLPILHCAPDAMLLVFWRIFALKRFKATLLNYEQNRALSNKFSFLIWHSKHLVRLRDILDLGFSDLSLIFVQYSKVKRNIDAFYSEWPFNS